MIFGCFYQIELSEAGYFIQHRQQALLSGLADCFNRHIQIKVIDTACMDTPVMDFRKLTQRKLDCLFHGQRAALRPERLEFPIVQQ
jgi:hypothetical protein